MTKGDRGHMRWQRVVVTRDLHWIRVCVLEEYPLLKIM
jgi:hypothetical protein